MWPLPAKREIMKRKTLLCFMIIVLISSTSCVTSGGEPDVIWVDYFQRVEPFSEGLSVVKKDDLYGYIDTQGQYAVEIGTPLGEGPHYVEAYSFSEGLALVQERTSGKHGFIDRSGAVVIPLDFLWSSSFSEGLAAVTVYINGDYKLGYIDSTGNFVIPPTYHWSIRPRAFSGGMAVIEDEDGKFGCIDRAGNLVLPYEYDNADSFDDELLLVEVGRNQFFIDKTGQVVIGLGEWETISSFSQDKPLIPVKNDDGKYGYINKKGELIIPFQYDDAHSFSEGIASVEKDYRWGCINEKGELIIDFEYAGVGAFHEGLAPVQFNEIDRRWGYIDQKGNTIIDGVFTYAYEFSEGYAWVEKQNQFGIIKNPLSGMGDG